MNSQPGPLSWKKEAATMWAPPPLRTVSEWADQERRLSSESSAEPGRWNTARAEYQRGIMDAVCDPAVETVVVMSSAQVGKTEFLLNVIGYFVDQEPAPILLTQPTLEMAQAFSKDRLAPMVRDTPTLKGRVADPKSKKTGNTLLHKTFPGGHITMAGANSPASLASRPVRAYLADEIDRYPVSAGTEGDPVSLGRKRTQTFWNRCVLLTSTPTIKGVSRIEAEYELSDKRRFYVPCPHCQHFQPLIWAQVNWEGRDPLEAMYCCEECGGLWSEIERKNAVKRGEWRATEDFNGRAGFHLNELYSPWSTLAGIVTAFLEAKGNPETLQTWTNTVLGETWEVTGDVVDRGQLYGRREYYAAAVPAAAVVLTAAADVQDDRIEVGVEGWGVGEENFKVDYRVFYGDPAQPELWRRLREYLDQRFLHESGNELPIACAVVDSGGHYTEQVYKFVKPLEARRVYAIRGRGQDGTFVNRPTRNNNQNVPLFTLGVDTGKEVLSARLRITEPGPGYQHFPVNDTFTEEYFAQLTAETCVTEKVRGVARRVWKKIRPRNEAWDIAVYNLAALYILNPSFAHLKARLEPREIPPVQDPPRTTQRRRPAKSRKTWATDI